MQTVLERAAGTVAIPNGSLTEDDIAARSAAPSASDAEIADMRATAQVLLALVDQMVTDHVPEGALHTVLTRDLAAIAGKIDAPDLAQAETDGQRDRVLSIYAQAITDLERARTLARIEHERALVRADDTVRTPQTTQEACAFLGLNPRAGEVAAKKVVDALRQSWHPDLSFDESDRQARETRIKQINVAWDLVRGR